MRACRAAIRIHEGVIEENTFLAASDASSLSNWPRIIGVSVAPGLSELVRIRLSLSSCVQTRTRARKPATHALTPTDAGVRFYEHARLAIHAVDEAELEARGEGAGLSGRLRVCAATTFARLMVMPRLPEFLSRHSSLDIDAILDDRVIDLMTEGIDIALRLGTLANSTAAARKIASGERSVVATSAYLAHAETPKSPPASPAISGPKLVTSAMRPESRIAYILVSH